MFGPGNDKKLLVASKFSTLKYFCVLLGVARALGLTLTCFPRATIIFRGLSASAGDLASHDYPEPRDAGGPSGIGGPPPAGKGAAATAEPSDADVRWPVLVRRLWLLFYLRRFWAGL